MESSSEFKVATLGYSGGVSSDADRKDFMVKTTFHPTNGFSFCGVSLPEAVVELILCRVEESDISNCNLVSNSFLLVVKQEHQRNSLLIVHTNSYCYCRCVDLGRI